MINQRASDVRLTESITTLSSVLSANSTAIALLPIISNQGSTKPKFFPKVEGDTDFLFEYGNPNPSGSPTVQCGVDFFTEGEGAWAIRIVGDNAKTAGVALTTTSSGTLALDPVAISDTDNIPVDIIAGKEALAVFYFAMGPGTPGNAIQVGITASAGGAINPIASVTASLAGYGALEADSSYEYHVAPITSTGELNATIATIASPSSFNGAITLQWPAHASAIGYYVYGRTSSGMGRIALVGIGTGSTISYVDDGSSIPNTSQQPITALSTAFQDRPFTVNVYKSGTLVESKLCSLRPQVSPTGVQLELGTVINNSSKYIRVVNNVGLLASLPNISTLAQTGMIGGTSGAAPTTSQIITALEKFKSRAYNVTLLVNSGLSDPRIQTTLDQIASSRGDAVALLDVPSEFQEWNKAVDYRNLILGWSSSYSALFCQDQLQTVSGMNVYIPMSGQVAARCAYTDKVANPANSPAGMNRGKMDVLGSRYDYDDAQATALSRAHVNYTRTFTSQGTFLWEQQLLDSDMHWMSIRRMVNVIKTSVHGYLLKVLQEMNTDSLRRELVNSTSAYLERVKLAGGISEYLVIADSRNNTPDSIKRGVLCVKIIIVPEVPTHEIQLNVEVSQAGVAFTESVFDQTSRNTIEFSSGPLNLPYGQSHTTNEYSSGTLQLPYGQSHTTNEYSSTRS